MLTAFISFFAKNSPGRTKTAEQRSSLRVLSSQTIAPLVHLEPQVAVFPSRNCRDPKIKPLRKLVD